MSRLDDFILRMSVQRACLEWAFGEIASLPGPVLEFGLGSGRSFDHLRQHLRREIFVFDREPSAPAAFSPEPAFLILGDFRDSVPAAVARFARRAALIHGDVGSYNHAKSRALAGDLAPHWAEMLQSGGVLVSDTPVEYGAFAPLPLPGGISGPYYLFKRR
jgi:hypothetical protein